MNDEKKMAVYQSIQNIVKEEELPSSVVKDFLTTASDGKTYNVKHYNLDMILSLGYRAGHELALPSEFEKITLFCIKVCLD